MWHLLKPNISTQFDHCCISWTSTFSIVKTAMVVWINHQDIHGVLLTLLWELIAQLCRTFRFLQVNGPSSIACSHSWSVKARKSLATQAASSSWSVTFAFVIHQQQNTTPGRTTAQTTHPRHHICYIYVFPQ